MDRDKFRFFRNLASKFFKTTNLRQNHAFSALKTENLPQTQQVGGGGTLANGHLRRTVCEDLVHWDEL